jgi:hypothetical protein
LGQLQQEAQALEELVNTSFEVWELLGNAPEVSAVEQQIQELEARHAATKKTLFMLPPQEGNDMMGKTTMLTKQINQARAQHKEISAEAMTFYGRTQTQYDAWADIHAIMTKVIQDVQVTIDKDKPQIEEAKQLVVDA